MGPFNELALANWRLQVTYRSNGDRSHRRSSGDDETWRPVKRVGGGSFGDVWQERCTSGPSRNELRAVKQLHKRQSKFLEMSQRELDALVTFSTAEYKRHFVQFLGWFDDSDHFYLAMEFVEHGDLQRFITAPFPEVEAAAIVTQIAQALQYMHKKSFVHRDVKPLNILVSCPRPNWHVKLADFGITKHSDGTALNTHFIGSPGYMAPELFGDPLHEYTAAVDIWALGAVAFCLRTGFPPFQTIKHLLDYARDHRVQFPIRPLGSSSGFCMNFVLGTMADLPERRLTIEHVLAHDWLSEEVPVRGDGIGLDPSASSMTWDISPSNTWSKTSHKKTEIYDPQSPFQNLAVVASARPPPPSAQLPEGELATTVGNLELGEPRKPKHAQPPRVEGRGKRPNCRLTIICGEGLPRRHLLWAPNAWPTIKLVNGEIIMGPGPSVQFSRPWRTRNPVWNEHFDLNIGSESKLWVLVFDENGETSSHLGSTQKIVVSEQLNLKTGGDVTVTYPLGTDNEFIPARGSVRLRFSSIPGPRMRG